jgi:DNA 3'-phosphatase
MAFEDIINENGHILFWLPENKYRINSEKILGIDLDWTIIKPVKGKIHPIDENDWEFFQKDISRIKYKIDDGYKFVIFTNQGGLLNLTTGKMGVDGFKKRWHYIYTKLQTDYNINSVYLIVSLQDDFNRKPSTGMWDFVANSLNGDKKVNLDKSLYVGDMAGRKSDHSSTDLLFALNIGVNFKVPEVFYNDNKDSKNNTKVLIESIKNNDKIFNGKDFIEHFDVNISRKNKQVTDHIKTLLLPDKDKDKDKDKKQAKQYLILFVGSPASGKTSFYEQNLKDIYNLVYLSSDIFNGTPSKFNKEIEKELLNKKNVLIDNTNSTSKTREKYIKLCKELATSKELATTSKNKSIEKYDIDIIVIKFNTSKNITLHLNALRTKLINTCVLNGEKDCKHNVPAVAIHSYWKRFEEPDKDKENINYLFEIEYEPIFTKKEGITQEMFNILL